MVNAKIYVATHKRDNRVLCAKDPIYIPIHCGKDIYIDEETDGYLPELGDNTGDNISKKNLDYCELTAMYWVWKNDNSQQNDIIGLNHYRRYFREPDGKHKFMSQGTMEDLLFNQKYDYIVAGVDLNVDEFIPSEIANSIRDDYREMHDIRDLDNAINAIHILYPDIADRMDYVLNHNYPICYCNMLISTKKKFDEYALFLFSVLNYVENNYGISSSKGPGYSAERLLRPWLIAKNYKAVQGHEIYIDDDLKCIAL